jgi:hypothetical protein
MRESFNLLLEATGAAEFVFRGAGDSLLPGFLWCNFQRLCLSVTLRPSHMQKLRAIVSMTAVLLAVWSGYASDIA